MALISDWFGSVYEGFNYFECAAWIAVAAILPIWFRACAPAKKKIVLRASLVFVLFGVSDYLEAPTHGMVPAWLWAWKLGCAALLIKCRHDFLGSRQFWQLDRNNVFGLCCLLAVLLAMFLQYHYRDLLSQ